MSDKFERWGKEKRKTSRKGSGFFVLGSGFWFLVQVPENPEPEPST